jgi:hypothetical protein
MSKYSVLVGLAARLQSQLPEDEAEMNERGFSSASRSKEFAALIETLYCELYAALDGVRRVLYAAYRNVRGVQNKSTQTLFIRATDNEYGPGFPEVVRAALVSANATWFQRLCQIRTEVTHGEVGSCHLDRATGRVDYMHVGLGSETRAFVIEDVITEMNYHYQAVSALTQVVYQHLFSRLDPVPQKKMCGMYKGRGYAREVAPTLDLSFNSGSCLSRSWFENEPGFECPMRERCGAYPRPSNHVAQADQTDASAEKPTASSDDT